MAKKKKATEALPTRPNYNLKSPLETNHSRGFFWVRERPNSWSLYYDCSKDGVKQKSEKISVADYKYCHLRPEMSVEQARAQITSFNKDRKKNLAFSGSQVRASRRQREMLEADKDLFPEEIVLDFFSKKIEKRRCSLKNKNRVKSAFAVAQRMVLQASPPIKPGDYADNIDIFVEFFRKEQYSVSYSMDILAILELWGKFASKIKGTYYEKIPSLDRGMIASIQIYHELKTGVRRESLPMTETIMKKIFLKIDHNKEKEVKNYNWLFCAFYLALRPSELDRANLKPRIEYKDSVPVLVIDQTKLSTLPEEKRLKRIPILSEEQMTAFNLLKEKNSMKRPTAKWVNNMCETVGAKSDGKKYDLYAGRKGYSDILLKTQTIAQTAKIYGHHNINTLWKHYVDKNSVDFTATEFTEKFNGKNKKKVS